jgi:uncharacterized protein with HEPN domain
MRRDPEVYLEDILGATEKAGRYAAGLTRVTATF